MITDSVRDELALDFDRVRLELLEARLLQREKDTPAHRNAVADCSARLDAVLDRYLAFREIASVL
ncbi:MAG TPA: hypothetical protein VHF92_18750 [Geodermatophilus sp.]|nr:hypothetical protein [Geodermatophilus sp.]